MNSNTSGRQPTIHSPGTRRLTTHVRTIRRRDPALDHVVSAIHDGDDHVLHQLVARAHDGDADAAVTAIWAILPRLAAVVINRLPVQEWQAAMDDYLTTTYLTLVDVDLTAPPEHLSDKIIARTRRRVERSQKARPLALCGPETLTAIAPAHSDVEERALARCEIDMLAGAVRNGLVDPESWRTLLELRFNAQPGTASARDRKAASRARTRLQEWAGRAA